MIATMIWKLLNREGTIGADEWLYKVKANRHMWPPQMISHPATDQLPTKLFMRRERRRLQVRHIWRSSLNGPKSKSVSGPSTLLGFLAWRCMEDSSSTSLQRSLDGWRTHIRGLTRTTSNGNGNPIRLGSLSRLLLLMSEPDPWLQRTRAWLASMVLFEPFRSKGALCIRELLQDYVTNFHKVRRLHLIVVDLWRTWNYNTARAKEITDNCGLFGIVIILVEWVHSDPVALNLHWDVVVLLMAMLWTILSFLAILYDRKEEQSYVLLDTATSDTLLLDEKSSFHPLGMQHFYDSFALVSQICIRSDVLVLFDLRDDELLPDLHMTRTGCCAQD